MPFALPHSRNQTLTKTFAYTIGFPTEQDMHYAEFAEDEVSSFVRLTHP